MADNDADRTEAPTQRRRDEARQEGNVARSTDLTAAGMMLGSIVLLYLLGKSLMQAMSLLLERMLGFESNTNPTRLADLGADLAYCVKMMVQTLGPLVLGIAAVAMIVTVGQVGFLLTSKSLKPNFGRMSPLRGIKNLFDIRAGVRLGMSIVKIAVIVAVATTIILEDMPRIVTIGQLEVVPMFAAAASLVFLLGVKLSVLLVVLALFDFAFQKYQRERDLRMTKQDVREDLKRMEGDPLIKHRRTRVARQLALQRISHAVPKADVIVTNPTHYAVALQYESATMAAPKVVAKGADYLAARIRQLAVIHGIVIVERKELAQAMYKTVEVGQQVPPQYFSAVAEILAYVYRLSGRKTA